jgi:cytochrome P450
MTTAHASTLVAPVTSSFKPKLPLQVGSQQFIDNCYPAYDWLLEHAPVTKGKMSVLNAYFVTRYDDCMTVLKDKERFIRNRNRARGKPGNGGYPAPKSLKHLVSSIVNTDEPDHRRLRDLVHKAFTPRALTYLDERIEALTAQLLDDMFDKGLATGDAVDLIQNFSLPIPVTVISEMMGVTDPDDMQRFIGGVSFMSGGFGIRGLAKGLLWDLPKLDKLVRKLVAEKRVTPGEDILSGLVQAEHEGDRLTEDEVVGLAFILTFAGFETTVYLIANAVLMLMLHPEQREIALSDDEHLALAIEEIQRFHSSVHGTEANYALEDIELSGVTLPKGSAIFPLLAAGNRDPRHWDRPTVFDVTRTPNKHLSFGQGIHYCVGAPLARMETRIALRRLFERAPQLELAIPVEKLERQKTPLMLRYKQLPVRLAR